MSKDDVIIPGHFKLAGRFRPSHDGSLKVLRKDFAEEKASEAVAGAKPEPAAKARKKSRTKRAK